MKIEREVVDADHAFVEAVAVVVAVAADDIAAYATQ